MSDNKSETAAAIFDRTGKLAATLSEGSSGSASIALKIAAGISKALAAIVRAIGIDDAGALIEALAKEKADGYITPAEVVKDDAKIASAVADLYDDKTPVSKPTKKKRKPRKAGKAKE